MAIAGEGEARGCGSQFFFTLAGGLDYLDGKHAPFGTVVEGEDTLAKINEAFTDGDGKPLRDIRIRHVVVLGASSLDRVTFSPKLTNAPAVNR
jgi:peptidyl-prolyl cis-trans isomerase-like 4